MAYVAPGVLNRVTLRRGRFGLGGSFNQKAYPVTASQSIRAGDLLKLSASGTVEQAIAAPAVDSVTASGGNLPILGIALENITVDAAGREAGTGKSTLNVAILDPSLEVGMRIYHATPASAKLSALTLGQTYQFVRYTQSAGNSNYYLATTTSNGELVYVEPYIGSSADDNFGVAWCRLAISETIQQG